MVRMLPTVSQIEVGDRVRVVVEISGAVDVGHVPFHVTVDPSVLRFENAHEGTFLRSDGRETAFFAAAANDTSVVIGLSRLRAGDGIDGSGELCVLHFTAVGPGDAGLAFSRAKVRDSRNRILPADFRSAAIVVR